MSAEVDNLGTETQVYLLGCSKTFPGYSLKTNGKTDFPGWIFCTQEPDIMFQALCNIGLNQQELVSRVSFAGTELSTVQALFVFTA